MIANSNAKYKLYTHRPALSYEDLDKVRKETGFVGTEGKCLVLKADNKFIVFITLYNKKANFDKIKEKLNVKKIRLASKEELKEQFGAEPGCAYPFGFDSNVDIYIDPQIYDQEWFLFSPAVPTKTIQIRGLDLKKIFNSLQNKITETTLFGI